MRTLARVHLLMQELGRSRLQKRLKLVKHDPSLTCHAFCPSCHLLGQHLVQAEYFLPLSPVALRLVARFYTENGNEGKRRGETLCTVF